MPGPGRDERRSLIFVLLVLLNLCVLSVVCVWLIDLVRYRRAKRSWDDLHELYNEMVAYDGVALAKGSVYWRATEELSDSEKLEVAQIRATRDEFQRRRERLKAERRNLVDPMVFYIGEYEGLRLLGPGVRHLVK